MLNRGKTALDSKKKSKYRSTAKHGKRLGEVEKLGCDSPSGRGTGYKRSGQEEQYDPAHNPEDTGRIPFT